jgi:pyruvate dehydrogenase E1 component alpha subunit
MIRIRIFENGIKQLIKDGLLSHFNFYTGAEAVAVGVSAHLSHMDQIGSTHRPIGHLIAKGSNLKKIMAEIMAKKTGHNKGKGGPYHIFDPSVGALGANGIVGGSVPMCAGYALANQLQGNENVSVSFFGEGASNQGGVQETLNLAACWKLPIVFVCENSSPDVQMMLGHEIDYPQLCIDHVSDRAGNYGIPGSSHNGWDIITVFKVAGEAILRARNGEGPTLLEFIVHRLDEDVEISPYCPIRGIKNQLFKKGILSENLDKKIKDIEIKAVNEAITFAIESPEPDLDDTYLHLYIEES